MFKKEKDGKTNKNLQKGGRMIGFSFYFFSNDSAYDYINLFKDKNRNY